MNNKIIRKLKLNKPDGKGHLLGVLFDMSILAKDGSIKKLFIESELPMIEARPQSLNKEKKETGGRR